MRYGNNTAELAAAILVVVGAAASVNGQTIRDWVGGGDGATFSDPLNWAPTGVPGLGDEAVFDGGDAHTVVFTAATANRIASIENVDVTFALGGFTYSVDGLIVGDRLGDVGVLRLQNGSTHVGTTLAIIGKFETATGTLTVPGGASLLCDIDLLVGDAGTGTLAIESGGSVSSGIVFIADEQDSVGTATVSGTGATWDIVGSALLGDEGVGHLTVSNGGTVTIVGQMTIGDDETSTGVVLVDGAGSALSAAVLTAVGNASQGSLTISNGATLDTNSLVAGDETTGSGDVIINGATWTDAGAVVIGDLGSGTLSATGPSLISTTALHVGDALGGVGSATIGSGSTVQVSGIVFIGRLGAGTLTMDGGTLGAAQMTVNPISTLTGSGQINSPVTCPGRLAPGNAAGLISISGNLAQSGRLDIELGGSAPGTGYDQVDVGGTAQIGGVLDVTLLNGFDPAGGTFEIVKASAVTGTFSSVTLPPGVTISYESTRVVLNGPPGGGCTADWNGDGVVNTSDFLGYLNDYNAAIAGTPPTFGDPDLAPPVGVVNTSDFVAYLNAFVAGCP